MKPIQFVAHFECIFFFVAMSTFGAAPNFANINTNVSVAQMNTGSQLVR